MPNLRTWVARGRGAATTEKLLVLLFAIFVVGGALMLFGPALAAKYAFVGKMLGMEPPPVRTLADGRLIEPERTNPLYYVLFVLGVSGFFAVLVAPMLFPRAKHTRQAIIIDLAERFPVLTPLINPDARAAAGMGELRQLADEVNALEKHKEGALNIQPHDYGKMALPSEMTVDADFHEMEDIEEIISRAERIATGANPAAPKSAKKSKVSLMLREAGEADQSEDTQMAVPLSQRLAAVQGDDEIPFDAVDPSVKPQMQPLHSQPPRGLQPADDSTTIDVGNPDEILGDAYGDKFAADILRQSGALPVIDDTGEATLIRDSQPLNAIASPDDATAMVAPLDREHIKSGPLASVDNTTPSDRRRSAPGLDATTQDFKSWED